jgi:uncharacterized protein YndB with AHSA1/START domain
MLKKFLIALLALAAALVLLLLTSRGSHYASRSSALIGSAPERVWALLVDVDQWQTWWPGVERSKLLGSLAVGSRIDLKLKGLPEAEPVTLEWLEPLQKLGWSGAGVLGSRVTTRLELQRSPTGTEVILSHAITGPQAILARFTSGDSFSQYQQLVLQVIERRLQEPAPKPGGEKD